MAEEQVTEQEILDEVPEQEQPPIPERPDYIPEKFYNPETGEIRTEEMAKSYTQLEAFSKGKEAEMEEKIINKLAAEHEENIPEKYELPALPEGITVEMVEENPMFSWWTNVAKENGMSQEEFEGGVVQYVDIMMGNQPDMETEMKVLGENGKARVDAVDAWAQKTFPPEEYEAIAFGLGSSAIGVQALERIIEMNKTGVKSEQFTQPEKKLTMADARAMMADPRYHDARYRDEAYVAKVDAAFRMLTK
tara:strand:- start:295 stop:1041 length:747 start_codon:yes stop_codon:yes gene_type:complete